MVVLGGPARLIGPQERENHRSRRRTRKGSDEAVETYHRHRRKIVHPRQYDAATRLKKNSLEALGRIWTDTRIGHLFLASREIEISDFREHLDEEIAAHNLDNPHWTVANELAWTPLNERACEQLLLIVGEDDVPKEFWKIVEDA